MNILAKEGYLVTAIPLAVLWFSTCVHSSRSNLSSGSAEHSLFFKECTVLAIASTGVAILDIFASTRLFSPRRVPCTDLQLEFN